MRVRVLSSATGVAVLAALGGLHAQAPAGPPLTTVSIKRNVSDSLDRNIDLRPGGRLFVVNTTLRIMLRNIDRLQEYQLAGGPDWVNTDRWDIVAVADGDVSEPQAAQMLKALLIDRFKLKIRTERRDVPIYALVRARGDGTLGPELRPSAIDCQTATRTCGDGGGPGVLRVVGRPFANLLRRFEQASGRMVIDQTGLAGPYDFTLRWRPDDAPDVNPDMPSLFTAVEEQLGLRLRPERAPVDVHVIESAERPIEDCSAIRPT